MTVGAQPPQPPTLTLVRKLYAVDNINNLVPVKLDVEQANYSYWCNSFKRHCNEFGVLKHIQSDAEGASTSAPPTDEWLIADSIVKSWIFMTLADTLQGQLVKANPPTAKDAWEQVEKIYLDNKHTRTIALKELAELYLPNSCTISFPNKKDDLVTFVLSIAPDEGYYMGGKFLFTFNISSMYPYETPKVMCITQVYHPNISLEGKVWVNGLRGDWTPVHTIKTIVYGLCHLFTDPSHEDPLNHEAAFFLRYKPNDFRANVRTAIAGGCVGQTCFPPCAISHVSEKLNSLCFR